MEEMEERKDYSTGLIIGKFDPPHIGHQALIHFGMHKCERLKIIVLAHDAERFDGRLRYRWLKELFGSRVSLIFYDPKVLDSSSVSDRNSSKAWAEFLKPYLKGVEVLIGSEKYVEYMADYLSISYLLFDVERNTVPVSASRICADPVKYWKYLIRPVRRDLAVHFCVCGSESTGKTTFVETAARLFDLSYVPEFGRTLVPDSNHFTMQDLLKIYNTLHPVLLQMREDPQTPIVLWDTDIITTISYGRHFFRNHDFSQWEVVKADYYFFLHSTVKHVQDGTRLNEEDARSLSDSHLNLYRKFNVNLIEIDDSDYLTRNLKIIRKIQQSYGSIVQKFRSGSPEKLDGSEIN